MLNFEVRPGSLQQVQQGVTEVIDELGYRLANCLSEKDLQSSADKYEVPSPQIKSLGIFNGIQHRSKLKRWLDWLHCMGEELKKGNEKDNVYIGYRWNPATLGTSLGQCLAGSQVRMRTTASGPSNSQLGLPLACIRGLIFNSSNGEFGMKHLGGVRRCLDMFGYCAGSELHGFLFPGLVNVKNRIQCLKSSQFVAECLSSRNGKENCRKRLLLCCGPNDPGHIRVVEPFLLGMWAMESDPVSAYFHMRLHTSKKICSQVEKPTLQSGC